MRRHLQAAAVVAIAAAAAPGARHSAQPLEQPTAADLAEQLRPLAATRGTPRTPPPTWPTSTTSTTPPATVAPRSLGTRQAAPAQGEPGAVSPTGRHLGRYRITCYGPPQFPAGQRTASGEPVGWGSIAGDVPRGTRLHLGPPLNVDVHVNDTGGAVHGAHLDLWRPSCAGWPNPTVDVTTR